MRLLSMYIASFPGLHAQQKLHGHGGLGMIRGYFKDLHEVYISEVRNQHNHVANYGNTT